MLQMQFRYLRPIFWYEEELYMHDGWVAGLLLVDICEVAGEKNSIAVSDLARTHLMIENRELREEI
jgi:hypothetical protein